MSEDFPAWLKEYTGLSLYDFRVLDTDNTSERYINEFYCKWAKDEHPTDEQQASAIKRCADEGFEIKEG